jgi:hypothetical protein
MGDSLQNQTSSLLHFILAYWNVVKLQPRVVDKFPTFFGFSFTQVSIRIIEATHGLQNSKDELG